MSSSRQNRGRRRAWLLAGATAWCTIVLGLFSDVASSLLPQGWADRHALWILLATAALAVAASAFTVLTARAEATDEPEKTMTVTIVQQPPMPAPGSRPGQHVVGEIPGTPPAFVAREAVGRLASALDGGDRVVAVTAISGGRGTGKTQIAAEYARQAARAGVPLVAWVPAESPGTLLAGLAEVAERLGVVDPDGDSERSARRLREALAERTEPAVLVLDNAGDPAAVRPYLPTTGPVRIIITSTDRAFTSLGTEVAVDVFDRDQSIAYLAARSGLDDDAGASAVAEELGDLPLALAQAATVTVLRGLSYHDYLERLRSLSLAEMLPADRGDGYPRGVAAAVMLATAAVADNDSTALTASVIRTVALLSPDGVSRKVLAQTVGWRSPQPRKLDDVLGRLVGSSLLVWAETPGTVVMHRLVSRTIRDDLEHSGRLPWVALLLDWKLRSLTVPMHEAWQRREEASEVVGHALSLWEALVAGFDHGHLSRQTIVARAHVALWAVEHLRATADLTRATEAGLSTFAICERILGVGHRVTEDARHALARIHLAAGRPAMTISLLNAAPAKLRLRLTSRVLLASAYIDVGDLAQAIPLLESILAKSKHRLRPNHRDTLVLRGNLAGAYLEDWQTEKGIALLEDVVARRQRVLGADHPATLNSRNGLGHAYQQADRLDEAIPLLEAVVADFVRVLGADHLTTLHARNNLASAYQQQSGQAARAIPIHEEIMAARARLLGPDHPDTLNSRGNLASAYHVVGELDRALSLQKATLEAELEIHGPDHPHTLISQYNLAVLYRDMGQRDQAIRILRDCLERCERVLNVDHDLTKMVRQDLDKTLDDQQH